MVLSSAMWYARITTPSAEAAATPRQEGKPTRASLSSLREHRRLAGQPSWQQAETRPVGRVLLTMRSTRRLQAFRRYSDTTKSTSMLGSPPRQPNRLPPILRQEGRPTRASLSPLHEHRRLAGQPSWPQAETRPVGRVLLTMRSTRRLQAFRWRNGSMATTEPTQKNPAGVMLRRDVLWF